MIKYIVISLLTFVNTFISAQNDTVTTNTGLKYVVLKKGSGIPPIANSECKVSFIFKYADTGKKFSAAKITYIVGEGGYFPAWKEAILLMKEGEKAWFFVPSKLGYAEKGYKQYDDDDSYLVKPNTHLVAEIELIKVK